MSNTFSRRQFVQIALAAAASSSALAGKIRSNVAGFPIGIQTYILRNLRWEAIIPAMTQVGLGMCELFSAQAEPAAANVPDIAKWRATVSLDYFKNIRKQFNKAGIDIQAYNMRVGGGGRGARGPNGGPPPPPITPAPITDDQIDRIFEFTKALGAKAFSTGLSVDMAKRFAPFAEKHKIAVAVTVGNPDVPSQILPISSKYRLDIDIGDYTGAGHDAVKFVQENYEHILDIHLKDRKSTGASVPFGQGDSHMKEILQFLKAKKAHTILNIDCDYPGTGSSIEEVKKCYDYVKQCLA